MRPIQLFVLRSWGISCTDPCSGGGGGGGGGVK